MTRINRLAGGAAALALCFSMMSSAQAGGLKDGPSTPPPANKWQPWVEGGGYLSTERHRGELDLFAPLWQSSVALMFFQASGKVFEDDIEEGNFALGFRQMTGSGWNLGLWAGYDVRNSEVDNTFHQLAFGFEALSDRWDLRANGYVALSDPEASPGLAQVALSGNGIFMTGGEEVPLSGFDGEIGYKLFGTRAGGGWGLKDGPAHQGRSHELRIFAGGYYFDDDDALDEIAGARARLEWRIDDVIAALPGSRLTFEGEVQYDDVREDQWEGGVRLRIPFGRGNKQAYAAHLASLTPQERRMTERVERDVDIVTTVSKEENVFDTLTGVRFDRAEVLQGGGDLQGTLDANGANSLIVLDGDTTTGSFTVGPGQTLQGGGSTIQVTGVKSRTTAGFTAPGAKPVLFQNLNQAVVAIDSDTHLAGLGIRGAPGAGIDNDGIVPTADGVSNVAITDTTIQDMGSTGIQFGSDHNGVLIANTSIQDTVGAGIVYGLDNSNIRASRLTLANIGTNGIFHNARNSNVTYENVAVRNTGVGIAFAGDASDVTLKNVIVDTSTSFGIFFGINSSDIALSETTVANVAGDAIIFNDLSSNIAIRDTSIVNAGVGGIRFLNSNSNITIDNVTIDTVGFDGIAFGNDNSTVTLANISISGTGSNGIVFNDGNANVAVQNANIANVAINGISFLNANSNVTVSNNTVSDTGNIGIRFGQANTNIVVSDNVISGANLAGIAFISNNSAVTISDNTVSNAPIGMLLNSDNDNVVISGNAISNTLDGMLFLAANTNVLVSNNSFSAIGDDVFDFDGAGNTLTAGSTGNTVADAPASDLCEGAGTFTGTLELTDQNGVLQTFVNGC